MSRPAKTSVRTHHLESIKNARLSGATWTELENKYPYHRTTMMRAVSREMVAIDDQAVQRSIRFTGEQNRAINARGGSSYVRSLIDRDIAERAGS